MIRSWAAVACLLSACATAPPASSDIGAAHRARLQAMEQNDLLRLAPMLAEDLVYVHSTGAQESKEEFLRRLREGTMRYRFIRPQEPLIRRYGSAAVVTGRADAGVTMQGREVDLSMLYTAVYHWREGRWQLVSWQSLSPPR